MDILKATPLSVCVTAKLMVGRSPTRRDWACVITSGTTSFAETFGATEEEAHDAAVLVKQAFNSYGPMLTLLRERRDYLLRVIASSDMDDRQLELARVEAAIALAESHAS